MTKLLLWGVGMWLIFMVTAIINAGARENLYSAHMTELRAHQLSSIIFSAAIFILTFVFLKVGKFSASTSSYILLGIMWLVMTVAFEFLAGHYIFGNSWEKLFADYNLLNGRVWLFVLLSIVSAPVIVSKTIE